MEITPNEVGEITLTLSGKEYTLRPGLAALMLIERESKAGLHIVYTRLGKKETLLLSDIIIVIWAGICASLPENIEKPTLEEIGEKIIQDSKPWVEFVRPVARMLLSVLAAGPKVKVAAYPKVESKREEKIQA